MGYSISTPIKSAKARNEMWAFLSEHYKPWFDLQPTQQQLEGGRHYAGIPQYVEQSMDWTRYLKRDGGLDYDEGKLRIGFNCGTSGGSSGDYAQNILRWVALQVGRQRKFSGVREYGFVGTSPYTVYDGYEAWPVLSSVEWEHRLMTDTGLQWLTDERGFRPCVRPWLPLQPEGCNKLRKELNNLRKQIGEHMEPGTRLREEVIRTELQRLSELWEER